MLRMKWILLCLIIVISIILFINIFKHERKYKSYLALGDSIAEGYALKNKNDRYAKLVQNNYKINDKNFINLSKSGMTAKELADNIKSDEYKNAIKNSDLITVSIGSNELLSIFTKLLQTEISKSTNMNLNNFISDLSKTLQSNSSRKMFENGINSYEQSWDYILSQIKEINPDATIVATEFYNPFHNIYGLCDLSDQYIKQMNNILDKKSDDFNNYYIARIYEDFNNSSVNPTNMDMNFNNLNSSSFDPHPSIDGHKIIADKIIEALSD